MAHLPVGPRATSPDRHTNQQHSYSQPQMPHGWKALTDPDSGKIFYQSPTGEPQREHPNSGASDQLTQPSSDYISSNSASDVPKSYVATHTKQAQSSKENVSTNQNSFNFEMIAPCMKLTKTLAERTKNAMDKNRLPEVIYRAIQMKNRQKEYKKLLYLEGAWGLVSLPIAPTNLTTAAIGGPALFAVQAWGATHMAIYIRSENLHNAALGYIRNNLGEQFADKINALPYDKKGLSAAKSLLYEIDNKFNVYESNPYYNTKILSQKEIGKGGDIDEIKNIEINRALQALRASSTGSSYTFGSTIRRRNVTGSS